MRATHRITRTCASRRAANATGLALAVVLFGTWARPARADATPRPASSPSSPAPGTRPGGERIVVLHSRALAPLVGRGLAPAFAKQGSIGIDAEPQPRPDSIALATADGRPADLLLVDDVSLVAAKLAPTQAPHYTAFASDSMVVAYRPESTFGKAVAAGRDWLLALDAGGVRMLRTEPSADALGRRTAFVTKLAATYYADDKLEKKLFARARVVPPDQLVPQLQRGEADVAILERSRAVGASLAVLALPIEIDLSDPGRAGVYASATVEADRRTWRGAPLAIAVVPLADAPHPAAAMRFVDFLGSAPGRRVVDSAGFLFPPGFPAQRALGQEP
ncbi:MAG: extracellular solute-binding protein [Alphaproteobacteria bacterium]